MRGGIHPQRHRHGPGEKQGKDRDGDRQSQPVKDQVTHRQAILEGLAKIAAHKTGDPFPKAVIHRPIQAVADFQRLDLICAHIPTLLAQAGDLELHIGTGRQLDDHVAKMHIMTKVTIM